MEHIEQMHIGTNTITDNMVEDDLGIVIIVSVRVYVEGDTLKAEPLAYTALDCESQDGKIAVGYHQPFLGVDPLWAVVVRAVKNAPKYQPAALAERFRTEDQWEDARRAAYAEREGNVYHFRRTVV
jgi:hypothetical protein